MDYDTTPSVVAAPESSCQANQIRKLYSSSLFRRISRADRVLLVVVAPRVVGGLLAFLFFGLIVSQVSTYLTRKGNHDSALLRAFVGVSFLLVWAHTVLEGVLAYQLVGLTILRVRITLTQLIQATVNIVAACALLRVEALTALLLGSLITTLSNIWMLHRVWVVSALLALLPMLHWLTFAAGHRAQHPSRCHRLPPLAHIVCTVDCCLCVVLW